eukprot:352338-Chlamydomonas_euryale.AAC.7
MLLSKRGVLCRDGGGASHAGVHKCAATTPKPPLTAATAPAWHKTVKPKRSSCLGRGCVVGLQRVSTIEHRRSQFRPRLNMPARYMKRTYACLFRTIRCCVFTGRFRENIICVVLPSLGKVSPVVLLHGPTSARGPQPRKAVSLKMAHAESAA